MLRIVEIEELVLKTSLPWRLSADLKNFKELTIGNGNNAVIMGRNTWVSLPSEYKPLPKRENIVLTTKVDKPVIVNPDCTTILMPSLKETLKYCNERKIFSSMDNRRRTFI